MAYVDGMVLPVRSDRREEYEKMSREFGSLCKEFGATTVVDCWGDDVPEGKVTSFPMAVKLEPGETVAFSWIIWPSREARDAGNKKMMDDPRMQPTGDMPFDMKRMIFGGFEMIP